MEDPPPSKHIAAVRCHDVHESARDGVGVDGKWYHKRVCEGGSRCGSVGTRMSRSRFSSALVADDDTVTVACRCH